MVDAADVVVHHGGSGTVLAALAGGVPKVILRRGSDQMSTPSGSPQRAWRPSSRPTWPRPDAVAEAARAALAEPATAESEAVRAELSAMPDPAAVADVLAERLC
jgi:hypothetical protein